MDEKLIDQTELANSVADKIQYEFLDYILVKELDPIKVVKEFSEPVGNTSKDENGVDAAEEVKKETREVDSDFRRGVVLKVPTGYSDKKDGSEEYKIHVGDVIIFPERCGRFFDLLKESRLVRLYDVIAIVK